jgi:DNA-binding PadR family transcriptional regulator
MGIEIIGPNEELTLRLIIALAENAYGVPIRQGLEEATKKKVSYGAVYTTLERLENKGFIEAYDGPPLEEREGRAKRFYKVTGAGQEALDRARYIHQWAENLPKGWRPEGGTI